MKRNEEFKKIFALDFAASGIKAIAAEVEDDNAIRILSSEIRRADAIKNGIIHQPTGTAFNVSSLLKQLKNSARIKENIKSFATGIGGKNMKIIAATYRYTLNKKREITAKDIDTMALECEKENNTTLSEVLDVIPLVYYVDGYKTENPEGMKGQQIVGEYHLVVGSRDIKAQFVKLLDRVASYQAEHTIIAPEAFAIAVSEEGDRKEGCAIINMGASSTTLIIYQNELIQHLLVVPFGSDNITRDIQSIGISEAHAEKLKCSFGQALEHLVESERKIKIPKLKNNNESILLKTSTLAMIIESRLDDIFYAVFQVLEQHKEMIPKGIIISGGGAKLTNIIDYIEKKSGFQTRYGDHSGWLTLDTDTKYHDLVYAQIIGIIILAIGEKKDNEKAKDKDNKRSIQLDMFSPKAPQKKKRTFNISDKVTQSVFKFFDDDTPLTKEANQES